MKTATIIKIVDKLIDFFFYFVQEKKNAERKELQNDFKEDPSGTFNDKYSSGVRGTRSDKTSEATDSSSET